MAELAFREALDRRDPEPGPEDPVELDGAAATLDVPEKYPNPSQAWSIWSASSLVGVMIKHLM